MKKKIFGGTVILSIVLIVNFNINIKEKNNALSNLSLENIEALAGENSSSNCSATANCDHGGTVSCSGKTCASYPEKVECISSDGTTSTSTCQYSS